MRTLSAAPLAPLLISIFKPVHELSMSQNRSASCFIPSLLLRLQDVHLSSLQVHVYFCLYYALYSYFIQLLLSACLKSLNYMARVTRNVLSMVLLCQFEFALFLNLHMNCIVNVKDVFKM